MREEIISLNKVKIPSWFKEPNPIKYRDYKMLYSITKSFGKKEIIIDENGFLVDGFIPFLILKENKVEECNVIVIPAKRRVVTYVYGFHPEDKNKKVYVWRVPSKMKINLLPGDVVSVETSRGMKQVLITRIENSDKKPVKGKIKYIIG